jgi:hypothetical protein
MRSRRSAEDQRGNDDLRDKVCIRSVRLACPSRDPAQTALKPMSAEAIEAKESMQI